MPRPTFVVADVHLGAVPPTNERAFLRFLDAVHGRSEELIINGDLFDFWFEYRTVILRRHFRLLRGLSDLVEADVRVRLVGGNHDAWGGSFLRDEVGIELLDGPTVTRVGGRRTYLAHGDGLGGGDLGYRALKRLVRSRPAAALFRWVHPDVAVPLVRRVSATEERRRAGPGRESARAERLSEHAAALLRDRRELDMVLFGHTHRPELTEVEPGRLYLNPGDWIHHLTYARVNAERVELRRWPDEEVLASVDARATGSPGPA